MTIQQKAQKFRDQNISKLQRFQILVVRGNYWSDNFDLESPIVEISEIKKFSAYLSVLAGQELSEKGLPDPAQHLHLEGLK